MWMRRNRTQRIRGLPTLAIGEQLSAGQQLDLTRLNASLDSALANVSEAQASIDTARLNAEQAKSQAGRQVRVVDPPTQPTSPQPETFRKIATLVMFTLIGVVISLAALLVTTLADHSIQSVGQLRSAVNVGAVTTGEEVQGIPQLATRRRSGGVTMSSLAQPLGDDSDPTPELPQRPLSEFWAATGPSVPVSNSLTSPVPTPAGEAIRLLLSRYEMSTGTALPSVIAVTSAVGGEGVTTLSRSLASILSSDLDADVCWVDLSWSASQETRTYAKRPASVRYSADPRSPSMTSCPRPGSAPGEPRPARRPGSGRPIAAGRPRASHRGNPWTCCGDTITS